MKKRKTKAREARTEEQPAYDLSFEILLRLARFAKRGGDVSRLLIDIVETNMGGLVLMPEFQCAMDYIPRPAVPRGL